jgi:hypothetical protein
LRLKEQIVSNWYEFSTASAELPEPNSSTPFEPQSPTSLLGSPPPELQWPGLSPERTLTRDALFGGHTGGSVVPGVTVTGAVQYILTTGLAPVNDGPSSPIGFAMGPDGKPNDDGWMALSVLGRMPSSELKKLTKEDLDTEIRFNGDRTMSFFELLMQFSPSSVGQLSDEVLNQQFGTATTWRGESISFADKYRAYRSEYIHRREHPPRDVVDRPAGDGPIAHAANLPIFPANLGVR